MSAEVDGFIEVPTIDKAGILGSINPLLASDRLNIDNDDVVDWMSYDYGKEEVLAIIHSSLLFFTWKTRWR